MSGKAIFFLLAYLLIVFPVGYAQEIFKEKEKNSGSQYQYVN